jgi:hypothetical protein
MTITRFLVATCAVGSLLGAPAYGQLFAGLGTPLSETYRAMFGTCDRTDTFGMVRFPIRNAKGAIRWFGCRSDPSRLSRLVDVPAAGAAPHAVIFVAKLAHDQDGSPTACGGSHGPTDQCATSLMLDPSRLHPCVIPRSAHARCVPVDADQIPYVVLPVAAPAGIDGGEFRRRSGLDFGDYGVAIANGRTIPVIVADGGPAYKIGEGSTALLRALASDGRPHTIGSGVTYVLFPGSRDPRASLSPDSLAQRVRDRGNALFSAFSQAHP